MSLNCNFIQQELSHCTTHLSFSLPTGSTLQSVWEGQAESGLLDTKDSRGLQVWFNEVNKEFGPIWLLGCWCNVVAVKQNCNLQGFSVFCCIVYIQSSFNLASMFNLTLIWSWPYVLLWYSFSLKNLIIKSVQAPLLPYLILWLQAHEIFYCDTFCNSVWSKFRKEIFIIAMI